MESIMMKYKEEILKDLKELVAIPSVTSDRESCEKVLDFIKTRSEELGFKSETGEGLYCFTDYGKGEEYHSVLTHLDVVPTGDGWNTPPFTLTEKDGYLYGRGTADDKGAAIVSLYCLKALKDNGVTGRKMRLIFGCSEETGMEDMEAYFKKYPLPVFAFTPDSEYPICNREKGILNVNFYEDIESSPVKELECGSAPNCVAEKARIKIDCSDEQKSIISGYIKDNGINAKITYYRDGMIITFIGKSAHAMQPHLGDNAIYSMLKAILSAFDYSELPKMFKFLNDGIGDKNDGVKAGINLKDEPSGNLTINIGILKLYEGKITASADMRYPVTFDGEETIKRLSSLAEKYGVKSEVMGNKAPIYISEDNEFIKILADAYSKATGEKASCYSTGGGTYARALGGRGVAFGLVFPDEPATNLHEKNENIGIVALMKHADICYYAMKKMIEEL